MVVSGAGFDERVVECKFAQRALRRTQRRRPTSSARVTCVTPSFVEYGAVQESTRKFSRETASRGRGAGLEGIFIVNDSASAGAFAAFVWTRARRGVTGVSRARLPSEVARGRRGRW